MNNFYNGTRSFLDFCPLDTQMGDSYRQCVLTLAYTENPRGAHRARQPIKIISTVRMLHVRVSCEQLFVYSRLMSAHGAYLSESFAAHVAHVRASAQMHGVHVCAQCAHVPESHVAHGTFERPVAHMHLARVLDECTTVGKDSCALYAFVRPFVCVSMSCVSAKIAHLSICHRTCRTFERTLAGVLACVRGQK